MKGQKPNRFVSVSLLVTLVPWCVGCATEIHFRRSPGAVEGAGGGRLLVRVFENRSDRKHDVNTHRTIVTELYRVEGRPRRSSARRGPRWSVSDLRPGEYVLRASRWVDEAGGVGCSRGEEGVSSSAQRDDRGRRGPVGSQDGLAGVGLRPGSLPA
jgi:hypothetical protein